VTVTPPIVTWSDALTVNVPGVALLIVIVNVRVFPVPDSALTVGVGAPVPLTVTTGAAKLGAPVPPGNAVTVAVNTSAWFTSFTGVNGVIEINASTQSLDAFGPSPGSRSPVVRVSDLPPTLTVVVAWIVEVPAVVELIVTSHVPVVPTVPQLCDAGVPRVVVTVHTVPAGAFEYVTLLPSLTLMWQCSVWLVLTGLTAVPGVIWIFASTNVLFAFALSVK
jgi:hypothetical protein